MTANNSGTRLAHAMLLGLVVLLGCGRNNAGPIPIDVPLDVDTIKEGWETRVSYPNVPTVSDDSVCELWVEDGWLHARRLCSEEVVWQVVLAKVEAGVLPDIKQFGKSGSHPAAPCIHITYADGRYFIRDNSLVLRTLRQQPAEQRPTFTVEDVLPKSIEDPRGNGWAGREGRYVTGKTYDEWFCAMSGPTQSKLDCFVRLNRKELSKSNVLFRGAMGFAPMQDGLLTAYYGARMASDDGELLVAHYNVPGLAQKELNRKRIRESLADGRIPELDGAQWFNTDPLSLQELRGKVVLVDFWATWCTPCVEKIPAVQELADKFADEGFVVIGIHSQRDGEACEAFAKKMGITFPLAVDTGKTEKAFGVEAFPSYFLIDKSGKVVGGRLHSPPDETTIRTLLEAETSAVD